MKVTFLGKTHWCKGAPPSALAGCERCGGHAFGSLFVVGASCRMLLVVLVLVVVVLLLLLLLQLLLLMMLLLLCTDGCDVQSEQLSRMI
jgi:hypothetical protein